MLYKPHGVELKVLGRKKGVSGQIDLAHTELMVIRVVHTSGISDGGPAVKGGWVAIKQRSCKAYMHNPWTQTIGC